MEKQNEMPLWMQRAIGLCLTAVGFILIITSAYTTSNVFTFMGLILSIIGLPLIKNFKLISIKSDYL